MKSKPAPILIVEDSPEDYAIVLRAFKKAHIANGIVRCQDGDEALDYLLRRGAFAEGYGWRRPALILLDLNLPGTGGVEVLAAVKADVDLRSIPVVILSNSQAETDVNRCYALGAAGYIRKQIQLKQLEDSIRVMSRYWFEIVHLPKGDSAA